MRMERKKGRENEEVEGNKRGINKDTGRDIRMHDGRKERS